MKIEGEHKWVSKIIQNILKHYIYTFYVLPVLQIQYRNSLKYTSCIAKAILPDPCYSQSLVLRNERRYYLVITDKYGRTHRI